MFVRVAKVHSTDRNTNTIPARAGPLLIGETTTTSNTMWTTKLAMRVPNSSAVYVEDIWDICLVMGHETLPEKDIVSTLLPWHLSPIAMSDFPLNKSEAEWKAQLSEQEYKILRQAGTEYPFTGEYDKHFASGTYHCKGCGSPLYTSEAKFDSGCGWPSYDKSIDGAITYRKDRSLGMMRVEILCAQCGGHQGHVFDDGPTDTGQRYCVNSAAIDFRPEEK